MPSALSLGRKGWQPYIVEARKRVVPKKPDLTSVQSLKRKELLTRIQSAATKLKTEFGVKKVILFGSFVDEKWFKPGSDVDLAVEGLSTTDFWRAWAMVESIIEDRTVDLIELEKVGESLKEVIRNDGVVL